MADKKDVLDLDKLRKQFAGWEQVQRLIQEQAELRHNFEQDRKVIANLKAQLSKSQERVKVLERLAIKKQWENIKQ